MTEIAGILTEARDTLQVVLDISDPASEVSDGVAGIIRELDALIARSAGVETLAGTNDLPAVKCLHS
jgi:hypothetical protein